MNETTPQRIGWGLFLLCALAFLAAAIRDGDALLVVASLLFLAGVGAFLVPDRPSRSEDQ